ncbi:hypothetical protein CDD82_6277 [Ophiocordyceps australis]|uniref:U6 small nuclear RNA (adenine-(43)-N(6))-methyltransferase n=1 Tax=Ophiocordyceps australis TaxID=1399860 RepID=A0A2C5YVY1_9HYPO|nr:hypothetical protein CDD82_6277 [Ophiocordyceps australis]
MASSTLSTHSSPLQAQDARFRNLYLHPPDFRHLSRCDADFAAVYADFASIFNFMDPFFHFTWIGVDFVNTRVKGRQLDFCDPKAVMQLTKTLLKLDFGIDFQLPKDRLCPPVANRHNYILWLKRLLDSSSYQLPGQSLTGLDIDIDSESLQWARANVERNGLANRIQLVARQRHQPLIPLEELGIASIDWVMTNPPFYKSQHDMLESAKSKSRPPLTACTGSLDEMVTEGGELGFVVRILQESLQLRERVQWYTCMLGFLSSVASLVNQLKEAGILNYAVTELVQGNKTRRWAVGWSFGPMRPAQHVARGTKAASTKMSLLPAPTEADVLEMDICSSIGAFAQKLEGAIGSLELISWEWNHEALQGTGRAADRYAFSASESRYKSL